MDIIRRSLLLKIFLLFGLMMGIFGTLMFLYINQNAQELESSETSHIKSQSKEIIRSLSGNLNVVFGVLSWDGKKIAEEALPVMDQSDLAYIQVFNEYGKMVYDTYAPGWDPEDAPKEPPNEEGLKDPGLTGAESASGEPFYDLVLAMEVTENSLLPVGEQRAYVGWTRIGVTTGHIEELVAESKRKGYYLIGVVLAAEKKRLLSHRCSPCRWHTGHSARIPSYLPSYQEAF